MCEERLTNPPKGYTKDHPYIELLKNKSFAIQKPLNKKSVLYSKFKDNILETYKVMLPFRKYLNKAVTV
jgi:uncharacterized protein (DUF2461 family)